jgi:hypothetical protein
MGYDDAAYARMEGGMDEPGTASWKTLKRRELRKRKLRGASGQTIRVESRESSREKPAGRSAAARDSEPAVPIPASDSTERADMQALFRLHLSRLSRAHLSHVLQVCCRDCKVDFIFSASEQQLFLEKEWPIPRQR